MSTLSCISFGYKKFVEKVPLESALCLYASGAFMGSGMVFWGMETVCKTFQTFLEGREGVPAVHGLARYGVRMLSHAKQVSFCVGLFLTFHMLSLCNQYGMQLGCMDQKKNVTDLTGSSSLL